MSDIRDKLRAALDDAGVRFRFTYKPPKDPSAPLREMQLAWEFEVTARHTPAPLKGTYSAGIAHAPSYRPLFSRWSVDEEAALRKEVVTGRAKRKAILPDVIDVFSCLLMDAEATDHPSFEDWAANYGYHPDSRRAEATYNECIKVGLWLLSVLGHEKLLQLREIAHEL